MKKKYTSYHNAINRLILVMQILHFIDIISWN